MHASRNTDTEEDFAAFYLTIIRELRAYVVHAIGQNDADDAVADTFVVVWKRWESMRDVPTDGRRAFTFGVARILVRAALRERNPVLDVSAVAELPAGADDLVDRIASTDRVVRLLALLNESERESMELTAGIGWTPTQAAHAAGCSVTAMTTRLTRARKALAIHLLAEREKGLS